MSEPFIGQIVMFGGNFAPRGWALCDGQLLAVSQNDALFSLLGTIYGGDGRTTFGLPDLRGRLPMHWGSGPGLTPRSIGQKGGAETVTLTSNQMPSHTHALQASASNGNTDEPVGNVLADGRRDDIYAGGNASVAMNASSVVATGGSQSHNNLQPFQCVNFIIALYGIYPSRS